MKDKSSKIEGTREIIIVKVRIVQTMLRVIVAISVPVTTTEIIHATIASIFVRKSMKSTNMEKIVVV